MGAGMSIQIDVPNLDAVIDPTELIEFARDLTRLARYSSVKANAMRNRLDGRISFALLDEYECECIYKARCHGAGHQLLNYLTVVSWPFELCRQSGGGDMGYAYCHGPCFGCGRIFSFNPVRVPSITSKKTGTREPICQTCVDRANPQRIKNGLPPIVPAADAYDACDESELY